MIDVSILRTLAEQSAPGSAHGRYIAVVDDPQTVLCLLDERDTLAAEVARLQQERDAEFKRAEKNGVDWEKQVYRTQEAQARAEEAEDAVGECEAQIADLQSRLDAAETDERAAFQRGRAEGVAEVLAKVRALPLPIETTTEFDEKNDLLWVCKWCGVKWARIRFDEGGLGGSVRHEHPTNGCLYVDAHAPTGRETTGLLDTVSIDTTGADILCMSGSDEPPPPQADCEPWKRIGHRMWTARVERLSDGSEVVSTPCVVTKGEAPEQDRPR